MQTIQICPACSAGHHGECPVHFLIDGVTGAVCGCSNATCVTEREESEKRRAERAEREAQKKTALAS